MSKSESPRECYMRHIAHANHFYINEVLNNQNQKDAYKENRTRVEVYPRVSTMVADEGQMLESEQQKLQVLRWKGNNCLSGMGGKFSKISGGYGQATISQSDIRQDRREQRLLQRELQVDELDNTKPKPKDSSLFDLQGQNNVYETMGKGNRTSAGKNKTQNPNIQMECQENIGNSRRYQGQLQNDNIPRQNVKDGGFGERTQSELQNFAKQTKKGLVNGKNSNYAYGINMPVMERGQPHLSASQQSSHTY